MAFYDEHKKVSRKEKVERTMMRGGFDDEGSRYGGKSPRGDRKPQGKGGFGGERKGGFGEGRSFGNDRKFGNDRRFDDRKPQGKGGFGGERKGGFGEGRSYGNDRKFGNDRRFDDRKPQGKGGFRSEERRPARPHEEAGYDRYRYDAPVAYSNPAAGEESDLVPNETYSPAATPSGKLSRAAGISKSCWWPEAN